MTQPASTLVTDDPYATAVMLLKVGAHLTTDRAAELVSVLTTGQQRVFAGLACTDQDAAEVVDRFMDWSCEAMTAFGLHDLADAIGASDPDRWSR